MIKLNRFFTVFLVATIVLNCFTFTFAAQPDTQSGEYFAFVFKTDNSLPENIYMPYKMPYDDIKDKGVKIMAKEVTAIINAMPEGRRCLDLNYVGKHIMDDAENVIWLDNGVARLSAMLDELFGEMKANGAVLDYVIDDFEGSLSNWVFNGKMEKAILVENDPRYKTEIRPILEEKGFVFTPDKETELYNIVNFYNHPTSYLIWNGIMGRRLVDYYNKAVYEPLKKHYPDVKFSNYGMAASDGKFKMYDTASHKVYLGGKKMHAGTHSSPVLYGGLAHITYEGRAPEGYPFKQFKGTSYNIVLFSVLEARECVIATDGGKFMPWIPRKSWEDTDMNNSYYDELIFHLGMMNPDPFLLFNVGGTEEDDQYLSNLFKELDTVTESGSRKTLTDSMFEWDQRYILTGMELDNENIWRITPDLYTPGITIDNFLTDSKKMIFQVGNQVVDFPEGSEILDYDSMSDYGYWVTSPKGTKPVELRAESIETPPEPVADENNNPAGHTVNITYTKYNPDSASTVPEKEAEKPIVNTSSVSGHWAAKSLNKAVKDGLIIGSDKGLEPDREVTKAEFITMVMRAVGIENNQSIGPMWYSYGANKALELGWTTNLSDIELDLNRAAAAGIIANAMQLDKNVKGKAFSDDSVINSTGYLGAVRACAMQDIINGYPDGTFRPLNTITRAEAVVIIQRAYY